MRAIKLIPLLAGWGLCFAQTAAMAQRHHNNNYNEEYKEHISKQYTVNPSSVVAIYNVFGSIKVEGTSGDKVSIEIDETITARDAAEMDRAKREFKMGFDQKADSLIAYTLAPYDSRPHFNIGNNEERRYYEVNLEYVVKVPNNISLYASTVNNGDVDVKDVSGTLSIHNVNGAISIINARGTTNAHTINGNLTVNYLSVPPDESSYYSLNGKLEVTYPANLSANLQFKSMNGQFYTDFDNTEFLPTQVDVTHNKGNNGTTYRLNKNTPVKVGAGGKVFKFETMNGNIYIKKQS